MAEDERSRRRWWRMLMAAAGLGLVALVIAAALRDQAVPAFTASGPPGPLPAEGTFPAASGDEFEGMLVGLRGTPVVVNVWASWCAPCRTETPLLQRAAETYAGRAVILGVASNDSARAAAAFIDEFGLTYPNVLDASGEIKVRLGLTGFPTTYLFDADGELRARVTGGISEQRLVALIEDALR